MSTAKPLDGLELTVNDKWGLCGIFVELGGVLGSFVRLSITGWWKSCLTVNGSVFLMGVEGYLPLLLLAGEGPVIEDIFEDWSWDFSRSGLCEGEINSSGKFMYASGPPLLSSLWAWGTLWTQIHIATSCLTNSDWEYVGTKWNWRRK